MLVTHLDKNYLPFGQLYLISALKNAPDEDVYISGANLDACDIKWLSQFHPRVMIGNTKIVVPKHIEYRRYMQCRISKVLVEAYNTFSHNHENPQESICIATNVDMLIRKPMDELYQLAKDNDVLATVDNEHLSTNEILNEVMVLNFSSSSIADFLLAYNQMWDNGIIVYRDDQRQLYKVVNEMSIGSTDSKSTGLKFGYLPGDYTDKFMQSESHIWSARCHNRFYNYNNFCRELGLPELKTCPDGWGC